jgi:hypothetical protein
MPSLHPVLRRKPSPLILVPTGFTCLWARHNIRWELSSKPGTGSVEKRMSVGLPHGVDHRAEKSSYRPAARTDRQRLKKAKGGGSGASDRFRIGGAEVFSHPRVTGRYSRHLSFPGAPFRCRTPNVQAERLKGGGALSIGGPRKRPELRPPSNPTPLQCTCRNRHFLVRKPFPCKAPEGGEEEPNKKPAAIAVPSSPRAG